jgi:predicted lactoylglutathione lyase
LDFEQTKSYQIFVVATDNGATQRTQSVSVTLEVTDDNDNSPVFEQTSYAFFIDEQRVQDVGTVTATDADSTSNGKITYTLSSVGHDNQFTIDALTGTISVAGGAVNSEEGDSQFTLTVVARDNGATSRSTSVPVTVNVNDLNDNAPRFQFSTYQIDVEEAAVAGDVVFTPTVTDADVDSDNRAYRLEIVAAGRQ